MKVIKTFFHILLFFFLLSVILISKPIGQEIIIVSGGPSLNQWEQFQKKHHDHWWGNFILTAEIRLSEFFEQPHPKTTIITWLIYKPSYIRRGYEEHKNLIDLIHDIQRTYDIHSVYFSTKQEFIDYLNHGSKKYPRTAFPITDFEYFGHSNMACFMFDYSNEIAVASKVWLHENELKLIHHSSFLANAFIKSWGCHTGESMSIKWKKIVGYPMIGAIGTTDYSNSNVPHFHPYLKQGGKWVK